MWRYAWAAPASALGLAVAVVALACGATARRVGGVLEVAGGALAQALAKFPPTRRFCAMTLGHVVLGRDHRTLDECRTHEHAHVRQYERWGSLFFLLYAGSSLWQACLGKGPYHDNHFERQARAEERLCAGPPGGEE